MCLTACFLATGGLRFYCFKMHVWSTTGTALVFYSQIHVYVPFKMYAIFACPKYFLICILGLTIKKKKKKILDIK